MPIRRPRLGVEQLAGVAEGAAVEAVGVDAFDAVDEVERVAFGAGVGDQLGKIGEALRVLDANTGAVVGGAPPLAIARQRCAARARCGPVGAAGQPVEQLRRLGGDDDVEPFERCGRGGRFEAGTGDVTGEVAQARQLDQQSGVDPGQPHRIDLGDLRLEQGDRTG